MSNWDFDAPQFYNFEETYEGSGDEWFDKKQDGDGKQTNSNRKSQNSLRRSIKRHSTLSKASKARMTPKPLENKVENLKTDIIDKNVEAQTSHLHPKRRNSLRLQKKIAIIKSCTHPQSPKLYTNARIRNQQKENLNPINQNASSKKIPTKIQTKKSRLTTSIPFSFEGKDRLIKEKKEKAIKEALAQEQKGRNFKANPIPNHRGTKQEVKVRLAKTVTQVKPFKLDQREQNKVPKGSAISTSSSKPEAKGAVAPGAGNAKKTLNVTKCKEFKFATDQRAQKGKRSRRRKIRNESEKLSSPSFLSGLGIF